MSTVPHMPTYSNHLYSMIQQGKMNMSYCLLSYYMYPPHRSDMHWMHLNQYSHSLYPHHMLYALRYYCNKPLHCPDNIHRLLMFLHQTWRS